MAAKKYNDEFHPQLARWIVSYGYSDAELAAELGVTPRTIRRWKQRHPAFALAITEASEAHDRHVERRLLDAALGSGDELKVVEVVEEEGDRGVKVRTKKARIQPSLAAQRFWLQQRQPDRWREHASDDPVVYDEPEFLK